MRTLVLTLAAAAAAGAAQAQSLELERGRMNELDRHRMDLERNRIEQDLRALQATQYRLETQMSQQAVRNSLYPDVPPIPLVSGGFSGLTGVTDTPMTAEASRQRAEQARAQTVERRLQDIRGPRP